jgi:hypothetical protein
MNYLDMVLAEAADQPTYDEVAIEGGKIAKKKNRAKAVWKATGSKAGKITVGSGVTAATAGATSAAMLKQQANKYKKLAEQTKNKEEKAKYAALAKKYNKLAVAAAGAAVTGAVAAGGTIGANKISGSSYRKNCAKFKEVSSKEPALKEAYLEGFYAALEDMGYDDYDYYDEDYDDYDYYDEDYDDYDYEDDYYDDDDETEAYLEGYYMAYLDNGYDI